MISCLPIIQEKPILFACETFSYNVKVKTGYWPDETSGPQPFTPDENYPAYITVISDLNIDGEGVVNFQVPTRIENEQTIIEISPTYETMWYLVTVSGDLNGDGKVSFEDFCKLDQYWLQKEPSVDISPLPYGDGIADYKDLAVFTDNYLNL